jgi:hypothetical protein
MAEHDNTNIEFFEEEEPKAWTMVGEDIPGSMTFLKSEDPQCWTSSGTKKIPFGVTHLIRHVGLTGQLMCYECFSVAQLQCQDCHAIFPRDQVTVLNWSSKILCLTCESKAQLECRDCHNTFPRAEIEIVGSEPFSEMVCKPCRALARSEWCGCD